MVGTSKILTVSYGTFSCTLEGFDDSFSTMKAIAEYFRGLAADDRYFGAEPPTPDADMLAQIAEREISRRVDASMGDDGIHLRARALTDQSVDATEAAEAQHDKESRAEVEAARKAAKAVKKAAKAKAKAEAKAVKEAEKVAKAEAQAQAVAAETANRAAQEAPDAETLADSDEDTLSDTSDDDSILSSVSAAQTATSEGAAGSEAEETRDDASSSVLAADDPAPAVYADRSVSPDAAPQAALPANPDSESVAAKLQRIRAVVGNSDKAKKAESDDLNAQFLPKSETPDVADFETGNDPVAEFDSLEAQLDSETTAQDDAANGTDMISRVMERNDEPTSEDNIEIAPDAVKSAQKDADEEAQPRTRVIRMKRADFEKSKAEETRKSDAKTDPEPSNSSPDLGLLDGADDLDDYLEDSDFADDVSFDDDKDFSDDLAEIQSDFEDDPKTGQETEVEPETQIEAEEDEVEEDDEADTIGAVAAAMAGPDSTMEDGSNADPADVAEDNATEAADDAPHVDDAALDRLLSETDVQMKEPEGSRRRDAIAQLKAAVAAKEAARQVGEKDDDGQDAENAFRNDLSEVTHTEGKPRPRPAVRAENRTERPRPAPLKLVAAQRIDVERAEKHDGPVVPRRVATRAPERAPDTAGSFAEFAQNMGASELTDLLEAAAAYTSFVEGAGEFSRPQILRRARAVASDDFNREDGLRSFADLLRSGRFTKVRNGRFQVADDSRYNPERRAS